MLRLSSRQALLKIALVVLGLAAISTAAFADTPVLTTGAPRFGVVTAGDASTALNQLGVTWWFDYETSTPGGPGNGVAEISLKNGRVDPSTLQNAALPTPAAIGSLATSRTTALVTGSPAASTPLNYNPTSCGSKAPIRRRSWSAQTS